jgi:hypothetical protein
MQIDTQARCARRIMGLGVALAAVALPSIASAQREVTMEPLREPTAYPIEVEPHFTFGAGDVYGPTGFGAGARLGVPLAVGHLGRVPQNLAISFGGDVLHYDYCYYGEFCSANYLMVPVAAQWNIGVARPLSVFLEGGAFLYKGWFDTCGPGNVGCSAPSDFGLLPTVALGGRIHFSPSAALTLRLGYPTSTIGVSFL